MGFFVIGPFPFPHKGKKPEKSGHLLLTDLFLFRIIYYVFMKYVNYFRKERLLCPWLRFSVMDR